MVTAQRRSPVKNVPARNGRLRRDSPNPCAPCRTVVMATVATRPQTIMLQNGGSAVAVMPLLLPCSVRQGEGGVDQTHMRERLGKVAESRAALNVDLLREQADIVGKGKDVLEGALRRGAVPPLRQVVHSPKAAN